MVIPATVEYSGKTFRVTSIGYRAFYNNQGITSVVIPEGVTDVGYSAFFMCMKLAKISLPDTLEKVDTYAFDTFIATEFDKMPASIQWIGESAFEKAKIATLDLPEGLTHIGNKAFYNAEVESLSLPESVTEWRLHLLWLPEAVLRGAAGQHDRAADGYLLELHSPEAHQPAQRPEEDRQCCLLRLRPGEDCHSRLCDGD